MEEEEKEEKEIEEEQEVKELNVGSGGRGVVVCVCACVCVCEHTDGHEGLGVAAGLGDPDAVDGEDAHLVHHPLDHPLGLVRGALERVEVQLGPARGANLFPLHQVPWGGG